jgi:hypothetical protein
METAMAVGTAKTIEPCREAIFREFTEQPGLRLTRPQAVRLLGASQDQCLRALGVLVEEGFLVVASDGQYCRRRFGADVEDGITQAD